MGRSRERKEKHGKGSEVSEQDGNEGTAARTRPISYEEIMLKRKSKKLTGSDEIAEQGDREVRDSSSRRTENASTTRESERTNERSKDSSGARKNMSEETGNKSSRNGVEKASLRSTIHKQKDSDVLESDKLLKAETSKELNIVDKGRSEQSMRERRRNEKSTYYSKNAYEQKFSGDLVERDRQRDIREEKVEKSSKRSHRNGEDKEKGEKDDTQKHVLGKERGSVIPDRNERKETFESHHDKQRHKRERSRSRDREDRHKRSPLPREHKRTSHHVKDHELSSHTPKDRSRRPQPNIDRSRLTNNGSSSSRKRHGGSTSGLGGYSPRKRRTEDAAKTPSPSHRSPEKRTAKWDVAPSGADKNMSGSVSSNLPPSNANQKTPLNAQEVTNAIPKYLAMSTALAAMSANSLSTKQRVSIDSVQLTEATRPMRRLYVDNVPASATDKALMEFLNNFLLSAGFNHVLGSQPCISCNIHKEKGQAVVEFLTPEDTSAALSLNGCSFSGYTLTMRRPKDYVEVTAELEIPKPEAAVIVNDVVKDSPHKIFVGGISKAVSSEMFEEIASSFGSLKSYHYEINAELNKPSAFLEYVDQSVTLKARAGLNGMKLGGQVITAVQAVPNASYLENKGDQLFYGIPKLARPLLEKPTHVLKLKNLFNIEGFSALSEAEMEEVLNDVRLECARFGAVRSIHVVKDTNIIFTNRGTKEATDDTEHARVELNLGTEETNVEKETVEELPHEDLRITTSKESPCEAEQVKEADEILDKCIKDDKPAGSLMDNESCQQGEVEADTAIEDVVCVKMEFQDSDTTAMDPNCGNVSVAVPDELPNAPSTLKLDVADNICMEASSVEKKSTDEDSKPEEVQLPDSDAGLAGSVKLESDAIENDDNKETKTPLDQEDKVTDYIRTDTSSLGTKIEDLIPEVNGKTEETDIGSAGNMEALSYAKENNDNEERERYLQHVFELASVFVEYRRTESSCTAAHCLHGRLFDDRIVTVEYVNPDLYRKVFPK